MERFTSLLRKFTITPTLSGSRAYARLADLRDTQAEHERRARDHAIIAAQRLAWRNYYSYLDHLQWQTWHERKAKRLQRKIMALERVAR